VPSVPRTLRCFFVPRRRDPIPFPNGGFPLVGTGLVYSEPRRAPPDVNPGTMQIAEQPGVPSRVVVFGNIWKKARLKRARQALSGARRHASLRHHAIRHHPNYVAREHCGLAPNSSARAVRRIATPGSSTAETNSSGSAPSTTSLVARTIDCCSNSIAMYRHSTRHSSQNPPRPGDPTDSYWQVEWSCRFVFPRSC